MPDASGPTLRVDTTDPTPPYEQVRRQIASLVANRVLNPGDRLPSLRQLAGDLGLAVGTVARAYAELEAAGVLVSRRGAGTRVAADPPRAASTAGASPQLDDLAREYLRSAAALGIAADEAAAAVAAAARLPR